jgi:hypothetical protein
MRMPSRTKPLLIVAVAGVVAMVPLRGDPRTAPLTHSEWAHMLLRGLDMEEALRLTTTASQAFSLLSWKESLAFSAERFSQGEGVDVLAPGRVRAREATAEVAYPVAVLRTGDYRLRLRMEGGTTQPVVAEVVEAGETQPEALFTVATTAQPSWVDAGSVHLDPGRYTTSVRLATGSVLEKVELVPPCLAAIEPPGGWKALATLDRDALAVTTVQAVDGESELPAAGPVVEVAAREFQVEEALVTASLEPGAAEPSIVGGIDGRRALALLNVPREGFYSISVLGLRGEGQSWMLDGCRKAVLCPDLTAPATAAWQPILTAHLTAGRHFIVVTLGPGAAVLRLRAEMKRNAPEDYVETLRRLGFDPGPPGEVDRPRAVEAMHFVGARRERLQKTSCGDVLASPRTDTALLQPVTVAQPGTPPLVLGEPPLNPPLPPPDPTGPEPTPAPSPTPSSEPTPAPSPTPVPTPTPGPTPTPTPVPTPIPSQPPGSPAL